MDTRIGRTFWLSEFTVSAMAERLGRKVSIPDALIPTIERLVDTVLQPLRDELGRPIVIISGYRPTWLNTRVGGSRNSAHKDARAADITVPGLSPRQVIKVVRALKLPIDQAIEEFGSWTHLGIETVGEEPRREFLQARKLDGKTVYTRLTA
jgi:putative chitinase